MRLKDILFFSLCYFLLCGCLVYSQCYNKCNGHGICGKWNNCECFAGYEGSDCSRKSCPKGPAFVDIPSSDTEAHAPIECSGQGTCDYHTGTCKCRGGFTGANCGKSNCLNSCSGHGQCVSLATAALDNDGFTFNRTTVYNQWDAEIFHGCRCDLGYEGADCSQRSCEYGPDPRLSDSPHEVVTFVCDCTTKCSGRFKLRLYGQEMDKLLDPSSTTQDLLNTIVMSAKIYQNNSILTMPTIDSPNRLYNDTICAPYSVRRTKIRFRRNYGDIAPLSVSLSLMKNGQVFFETLQTLHCDCISHPCNGTFRLSFDGEMSQKISSFDNGTTVLHVLKNMKTIQSARYNITATVGGPICASHQNRNFTITFHASAGNIPPLGLWTSVVDQKTPTYYSTNRTASVLKIVTNDGRDDKMKLCNGIGRCNFQTGICKCPFGWSFDADFGTCGRLVVNASTWGGTARCPGTIDVTNVGRVNKESLDDKMNYVSRVYISMNPVSAKYPVSVIYSFPWIAEQTRGAQVDRLNGQMVCNLTSSKSAGPIVLDSPGERVWFVDMNPDRPFIGYFSVYSTNASFTDWLYVDYTIWGLTLDAYPARRRLYWTVPGLPGKPDGNIYYASADDSSPPTVHSLAPVVGQHNIFSPHGIAIHYYQKRVFWVDRNDSHSYGVVRSMNFDGSGYKQDYLLTNATEGVISYNLTDCLIHFASNNTMYIIDVSHPPRIVAVNLDSPIYMNSTPIVDKVLYEGYYSPRFMNVTSTVFGGMYQPERLTIDEWNRYLLWTEPRRDAVRFARYVNTIKDDIAARGECFSGRLNNPYDIANPYIYKPVAIIFDRGMGPPRWGSYADCWGNGWCEKGNYVCHCHDGFYGDCQTLKCPVGRAWFHEPAKDNIAHDIFVECSGVGTCNRDSGECECKYGFEGPACERSSCIGDPPTGAVCYNKGRCRSMRKMGEYHKDQTGSPAPVDYGSHPHNAMSWDADMIYGCIPDEYGWYNAEYNITTITRQNGIEYNCPTGHNRRMMDKVYKQGLNYSTVFEIQEIVCEAWTGTFQLSFRGATTENIPAGATPDQLKALLEALPTVGSVKISMSASILCNDLETHYTNVTFLSTFGYLPKLEVVNNRLRGFRRSVVVNRIQTGTPETMMECSGHGECDRSMGECKCWPGYGPSDGVGNPGKHADCGNLVV